MRRYPALLGAAIFGLFALALPSSLTLPRTGPPTLAEFAPIPGESAGVAAPLADLAQTSSAGIGSGGNAEGAVGGSTTTTAAAQLGRTGAGGRARAGTKRCVGKPPRQTEDPMSPPCMSFFEGDNFGATAPGVTEDEIRVVVGRSACDAAGRTEIVDYDEHPNGTGSAPAAPAVLVRHFEDRYQTYGRRVHLYWFRAGCVSGERRAAVAELEERVGPFALMLFGGLGDEVVVTEAARRGIVGQDDRGGPRALANELAPHLMSVRPDLEERSAHIAAFVCAVVAGRPAVYSGDPTNHQRTRRFALVYRTDSDGANRGAIQIRNGIADTCGDAAGSVAHATDSAEGDVARWRSEGITTVMFVGNPNLNYANLAQAQQWYPEWLVVPDREDNGGFGRLVPPTQARNAFGIWSARRLSESAADHDYHLAYREACPGCDVPATAQSAYNSFLLLFRAIQAAGPRLTAAAMERGLRAVPPRRSSDPWNPAAYFGLADHFFLRDMAVIRWDAAAVVPRSEGPGCWRLVEAGARYRVEDWTTHPGHEEFDREPWPCQGQAGD